MNARVRLLEQRAHKTAAEIADRRTILDFFKDVAGDGDNGTDHALPDQSPSSFCSDDRTCVPRHDIALKKTFSSPELSRPLRPAERTGLASPPGHPIHLRLSKAVQMATKNAGEIAERRAWLDIKNPRVDLGASGGSWSAPSERDAAMSPALRTGADWEGIGQRQRHVPEKYLGILQGAGHGLTKEPPNAPFGPTNSLTHRLQVFEDRALWNASKLADQRTFLRSIPR